MVMMMVVVVRRFQAVLLSLLAVLLIQQTSKLESFVGRVDEHQASSDAPLMESLSQQQSSVSSSVSSTESIPRQLPSLSLFIERIENITFLPSLEELTQGSASIDNDDNDNNNDNACQTNFSKVGNAPAPEFNHGSDGSTQNNKNNNNNNNNNMNMNMNMNIPLIIHQTSKHKCLVDAYRQSALAWKRVENFGYYLHDEEAVDKLMALSGLQDLVQHCVHPGVLKAGLWRWLVLYLYGGVYADIDTRPGRSFSSSVLVGENLDALLLFKKKTVRQYIVAAAPRHPLSKLILEETIAKIWALQDTGDYNPNEILGDGVLTSMVEDFFRQAASSLAAAMKQRVAAVGKDGGTVKFFTVKKRNDLAFNDPPDDRKITSFRQMDMIPLDKFERIPTGISCQAAWKHNITTHHSSLAVGGGAETMEPIVIDIDYINTEQFSSAPIVGMNVSKTYDGHLPALDELTSTTSSTDENIPCDATVNMLVTNKPPEPTTTTTTTTTTTNDRKIPLIIHQTSKSRCMSAGFGRNIERWKALEHFSYYFHDDTAVNTLLLNQTYPEFPHLDHVVHSCLNSGATLADLWRLLVLYLYGGVYADIDSAPNTFTHETLHELGGDDDEAFFVVDKHGLPSQYFMAARPRHPLIRHTLQRAIGNLLELDDTGQYNPVKVTGPGIYRSTFDEFCRWQEPTNPTPLVDLGTVVKAGVYRGLDGASFRLVGTADNPDDIVIRDSLKNLKDAEYKTMNITHFTNHLHVKTFISCKRAVQRHHRLAAIQRSETS